MTQKNLYYQLAAIAFALLFITAIIIGVGASPTQVIAEIWSGAFGSVGQFARVIATLAPLLLCASGLLFTFTAGLYNLGIEGQIAFGAIVSTFAIQLTQNTLPPALVIALAIAMGGLGRHPMGIVCRSAQCLWAH